MNKGEAINSGGTYGSSQKNAYSEDCLLTTEAKQAIDKYLKLVF